MRMRRMEPLRAMGMRVDDVDVVKVADIAVDNDDDTVSSSLLSCAMVASFGSTSEAGPTVMRGLQPPLRLGLETKLRLLLLLLRKSFRDASGVVGFDAIFTDLSLHLV